MPKLSTKPANTDITKVTEDLFFVYDSGKIKGGIRHWVKTEQFGLEDHECYQFDSVAALVRTAQEMSAIPGFKAVEIVTTNYDDRTERTTTKVLYRWKAPVTDDSVYQSHPVEALALSWT